MNAIERWLVVAATLGTLAVNALANTGGLGGVTTGEVASRYDLPFTPAGYVFSIWGLIYLGLAAFTAFQFSGTGAASARVGPVRPAYVFTAAANVAWLWFWHHEALLASFVVIVLLIAALAATYRHLGASAPPSASEAWCLDVPFRLYTAWITVAALANLSVVLATPGVVGTGLGPRGVSLAMIAAAAAIAVFAYLRLRDAIFLLTIAWAAGGVALKAGQPPSVSVPAMVLCGFAGLGAIGLLLEAPRPAAGQSTTR